MSNPPSISAKAAIMTLTVTAGITVLATYFGGLLFAHMQGVPYETVTLTTLYDYGKAFKGHKRVMLSIAMSGLAAASFVVLFAGFMIYSFVCNRRRELHGSARFATLREVKRAGLLGDKPSRWPSIVVGKLGERFLKWAGQEFAVLIAPTRSGKDVGIVLPNLLSYPDSVVCLDLKLEAWKITAGFRSQHGQECYLFAPNHPEQTSHRWNPLSYIREAFDYRIGDIQNLANMWYPTGGKDAFWHDNAQTLFLGLVLYIMETPSESLTMANLLSLTTPASGESLDRWIENTIVRRGEEGPALSPECTDALRSFSANTETVRASILSTMVAPLKIFRNPLLAAATSGNDFDLRDLRRRRMSIYVGMTAEDLTNYTLLINTFFSQLINENTKALPDTDASLKYQCLLLLNEFAALGRVRIIQKAIGYIAAYNLRLLLIFQNKGQIAGAEEGYGAEGASTLVSNCAMKILFQPKENEDAREYSETLGYQTVKNKSRTRQYSGNSSRSENESDHKRALLLPQELKEIGFDRQIIVLDSCKPIYADKIIYWKDPAFEGRVGLPTPLVPRLNAAPMSAAVRALTAAEVEDTPVTDILNRHEILKAIGDAIGIDFESLRITKLSPAS